MNNITKTEIILSIIGFSFLFYLLTYLIPHADKFNLYEQFYADARFIKNVSNTYPIYKQCKNSHNTYKYQGYKTPFKTTSNIYDEQTLFAESADNIHTQENSDLLNTHYAVNVFPKPQNSTGSNAIFNDSYTAVRRTSTHTTASAHGFSRISRQNYSQNTNNRPFFAGEAIDELILVDPMTDPDEAERIPVGDGSWILLIFASAYFIYKNRKLYFGIASIKDKI